jgi:PadR family transcriptional regulator, regulatory protein AphA
MSLIIYVIIDIWNQFVYTIGMIKYILLGFLHYKPMTGYEMKQMIDNSTAHFWHAYHSQIYTMLRQMEGDGLVSSTYIQEEGQPSRRVYTLSAAGKADFDAWLEQPMTDMSPVKEELLVRLFFSGQRKKEGLLAELKMQRKLHQQKLEVYGGLDPCAGDDMDVPPGLEGEAVFWKATLSMGIQYEEMYLRWLDETIHMVENL